MARFIILRHGQTQLNREGRLRGRAEVDLDATGLKQAEALGRALPRWSPVAIYSSPLRRAWHTAEIAAQALSLPLHPLKELIDIDYGEWQGLSLDEAARRDGELYRLWRESPHRVRFPGGEGLEDVRARGEVVIPLLAQRHPQETVALVSHQVVCKVLALTLLGLDNSRFWQMEQEVACLNAFEERPPYWMLSTLNDTCHLKSLHENAEHFRGGLGEGGGEVSGAPEKSADFLGRMKGL